MRIRTFLKPLSFVPALLLMYMIYSFSAQEGDLSSSVSYKASCVLVEAADSLFDIGLDDYQVSYYATRINGVTRKLAHMTEYFLLAIAVSFPLYVYGLHGILLMILAGGLCIAFACGDEYHQSFVAGRSPSLKDVGIDSIGVFIGIIVVRIIGWTGRMTLFRPVPKDERGRKLSKKQQRLMEEQMRRQWETEQQMRARQGGPGPYPPDYPYPPNGYNPGPYPGNGYNPGPGGYYENGYRPGENDPGNGYGYGPGPYPPYGPSYPYPTQDMERQEDHSSDELSDDMPLSHLLNPKGKK
ncbi:MAG TPA: VanZ family protein [Candidatus Merdiplasma excrementigallinarum]|uniref:VanZ family protein n=1 Tax=Candidatus Merdiplasma excrementigallinarum TaxID=2840864 RepID=A0A9D1P0B5_9FIRM|nr:VanZ family protein [Candidatus Merdiplasma excrementigallinarum]